VEPGKLTQSRCERENWSPTLLLSFREAREVCALVSVGPRVQLNASICSLGAGNTNIAFRLNYSEMELQSTMKVRSNRV